MKEYNSEILGETIMLLEHGEEWDGPLVTYSKDLIRRINRAGVQKKEHLQFIHMVQKVLQYKEKD